MLSIYEHTATSSSVLYSSLATWKQAFIAVTFTSQNFCISEPQKNYRPEIAADLKFDRSHPSIEFLQYD